MSDSADTQVAPRIADLVTDLYAALAAGDRSAVETLLDPEFDALVTSGMPLGVGGHHRGPAAQIDECWWPIGRAFEIRVESEEWIQCSDGRLLVRGHYRGRARSSGAPMSASFSHLWTARGGRLTALVQVTDSAAWWRALEPEAP